MSTQSLTNRPLTVVFCLPGATFSGRFLDCWTELLAWCLRNNINPVLSRQHSCNIYYVRNMCLGADVMRGPGQKPFDGKVDYDYQMWIDSDIVFTPAQFARLLSHDKDIVAALYLIEGGTHFATVKDWDEGYFGKNGCFQFLSLSDLAQQQAGEPPPASSSTPHASAGSAQRSALPTPHLVEVAYTGMGFILVKRGVFEALDYPWFRPIEKKIGNVVDFTMEDVAFCLRAREKGFSVLVDTAVKVGHEKKVVL